MTTASLPASADLSSPAVADARGERHVRKSSAGQLVWCVVSRLINPVHLWKAASMQFHRKATRKLYPDHRLELYARILPSDFLHYGYFDSTGTTPESISLDGFAAAQNRYADLLIDLADNKTDPVLDIGCGMGGLSRMLAERDFKPTALTPDKLQAAYVTKTLPNVPVIRSKLETMPWGEHLNRFGTVFTAESLQYLKLDQALPVLEKILKPGGKWIACDYFLNAKTADKTCHNWEHFQQRLTETGWKITYERDVTANVLPTLAFMHMLATRFGMPFFDYVTTRMQRKQPGIHHLLTTFFGVIQGVADDNVHLIDPVSFARDRRYVMLVMERVAADAH